MSTLVLCGLALAVSWQVLEKRTVDQANLGQVSNRVLGHFLEIGLYQDQPRQIWASLLDLWWATWRLVRVLLWACLLFLIPLILVGSLLSNAGRRPVQVGESVVIRAQAQELTLPDQVVLEAGPLQAGEWTYWRVRPAAPGLHRLALDGTKLKLQAGRGWLGPGNLQVLYPERQLWLGSRTVAWPWVVLSAFILGLIALRCWR